MGEAGLPLKHATPPHCHHIEFGSCRSKPCGRIEGSSKFGTLGPRPLGRGVVDPLERRVLSY